MGKEYRQTGLVDRSLKMDPREAPVSGRLVPCPPPSMHQAHDDAERPDEPDGREEA
jgi:hypothetical protein